MARSRLSLPRASIASIKSTIKEVARFRWLIFFMGSFANFSMTSIGSSLSLAIVAMMKPRANEGDHILENTTSIFNSSSDIIIEPISKSLFSSLWFTPSPTDNHFYVDWTSKDKDRMLQASFWGVLLLSPFGGRICETFGPRAVQSLAGFCVGLSNLFFPIVARKSYFAAYIIRLVQGMLNGAAGPSTNVIISRWSTAQERTLSNALVSCGSSLGTLTVLPLAGLMASGTFLGGWPAIFYVFGTLVIIISIIWYFVIRDTPEEHPRLSPEELEEILANRTLKSGVVYPVPWRQLLTSLPVWAYLVPGFTYGWIVAVVISQIPSFYEDVLDFSHEANGFMSSLPWLVTIITSLFASALVDKIRTYQKYSLTSIRKVVTVITLGTVSVGFFLITLLGKRKIAVVTVLSLSKGIASANLAGSSHACYDIAPTFAGTLAGFASMVSSIASLCANEGVAQIVGNEPTAQNWYRFFYISSAINAVGVIFFCLFGSAQTQDWDPSSARRQSVKSVVSERPRAFSSKSVNEPNQHKPPSQSLSNE